MVVPVPSWREDHVASLHGDSFAVDGGEATLALDDEAHGKRRVSVCLCRLIWHDELKPGIQSIGSIRSILWLLVVTCDLGDIGKTRTSGRIDQH